MIELTDLDVSQTHDARLAVKGEAPNVLVRVLERSGYGSLYTDRERRVIVRIEDADLACPFTWSIALAVANIKPSFWPANPYVIEYRGIAYLAWPYRWPPNMNPTSTEAEEEKEHG